MQGRKDRQTAKVICVGRFEPIILDYATGFQKKDTRLLKYFQSIFSLTLPFLTSRVDQKYFSILKNGRLLWETLYMSILSNLQVFQKQTPVSSGNKKKIWSNSVTLQNRL